jgi:hypothetical protein
MRWLEHAGQMESSPIILTLTEREFKDGFGMSKNPVKFQMR